VKEIIKYLKERGKCKLARSAVADILVGKEKTSRASQRFFREKLDLSFHKVGKRAGCRAAEKLQGCRIFRILDSGTCLLLLTEQRWREYPALPNNGALCLGICSITLQGIKGIAYFRYVPEPVQRVYPDPARAKTIHVRLCVLIRPSSI
jgi:hypothetical protein